MPDAPLFLSPGDPDTRPERIQELNRRTNATLDQVEATLAGDAPDDPPYAPAVPSGRPAMPVDHAELHDTFLGPNGVNGWMPEHAEIIVESGFITFPTWRHLDGTVGGWGHDVAIAWDRLTPEQRAAPGAADDPANNVPEVVHRTAPLVAPVTDRVRELFALSGLRLVER